MAEREHTFERVCRHGSFRWMVIGCLCEIGLYCCCRTFVRSRTLLQGSVGCCGERGLEEDFFFVFLNVAHYWWFNVTYYSLHQPVSISFWYFGIGVVLIRQHDLKQRTDSIVKKRRAMKQETVIRQQKSTLKLEQFQHSPQKPSDQWASGRERLARLPRGSRGTTNSSPFSCLREDLGSLFDPAASRAGRLSGGLWERKFSEFPDFLMSFCRDFMMRLI